MKHRQQDSSGAAKTHKRYMKNLGALHTLSTPTGNGSECDKSVSMNTGKNHWLNYTLSREDFWRTLTQKERDFFSALNEQFNTSFMHAKRVK